MTDSTPATAAPPDAQRKLDAATVAHHRRYCLTCAQEKPCVGPSAQECRDVEVILNAYDAG